MKYALFLGCTIPARLKQYEASARAVCAGLGIELVDVRDFNCCGYPMRNYDNLSFLLSSSRNIALAARRGLDIITLCMCCYGSLKKAQHLMAEDMTHRREMEDFLAREKLAPVGDIAIRHILSVLHDEVGLDAIRKHATRPFRGVKIAAHYGCHALRPKEVVEFDDPHNPGIFDELVEATGAQSIDWQMRLDCCGAPLLGYNDELSLKILNNKLESGMQAGAHYLCAACPFCQLQFDRVQNRPGVKKNGGLSSILYTQLLGLSMGISAEKLQIDANELDISGVEKYMSTLPPPTPPIKGGEIEDR
jgi:heterodisulfide reductase subunit B